MDENETPEGQEEEVAGGTDASSESEPEAPASPGDPSDDSADAVADAGDPESAADEPATSDVAPESPDESPDDGVAGDEDDEDAPGGAAVVDSPAPSMTDTVQERMVDSIGLGQSARRASIARNREIRSQQHQSLERTNRPDIG